jgi:hypothetical protein
MRRLLRYPSAYLALPLLLACALTLPCYDLPAGYADGILVLAVAALGFILLDVATGVRLPTVAQFRARRYVGTREAFVGLSFAALVIVFCLLDLGLFPIPLLDNPSSYATMEPGREHVRHLSSLCWTLPVIGLLCTRHRALRYALVGFGVVFPILVIDRNRIFAALFSFALVLLFRRDPARPVPWKALLAVALAGATVFSVLGAVRSGSLDGVALPFSPAYRSAPQGVKWLLLYVSAGPYNFSSMLAKHYVNDAFLYAQLVPGTGAPGVADTDIPLDAPNINVGTEFLPFLMAWGMAGAVAAMLALYALLSWSIRRLRAPVSLFGWLIFLRVAYVCVMSPFAPQAFIWTNFAFVGLCLAMQASCALLPNRRASSDLLFPTPARP